MSGKGYGPEEAINRLREADILLGQGKTVGEVIRQLGVNKVTYYIYGRLSRCKYDFESVA